MTGNSIKTPMEEKGERSRESKLEGASKIERKT